MSMISIVTTAYNAEKFLSRTIGGVQAQTLTDWEYIVVDDGSSDATYELACSFAAADERIKPRRIDNCGTPGARNYGYSQVCDESDYVIFLDHDDLWKPNTLEILLTKLEANPSAVGAHGMRREVDMDGNPSGAPGGFIANWERRKMVGRRIVKMNRTEPTTFACLITECPITTVGTVLLRRSVFDKIDEGGGVFFDPWIGRIGGDDWDAWLRLSLYGYFAFVDEVVIDWRKHERNLSKDETITHDSEAMVRRKMYRYEKLTPYQRNIAKWRCHKTYYSHERNNAKDYWLVMKQELKKGRMDLAHKLFLASLRKYAEYVRLKHFWRDDYVDLPIPPRFGDMDQVVDAVQNS